MWYCGTMTDDVVTTTNPTALFAPDGTELVPCGSCGGFFAYAALFSHDCAGERPLVETGSATPASMCSVDPPAHGTGSVRPPSDRALGLLAALVRGTSFAAVRSILASGVQSLALDPADTPPPFTAADAARQVEEFVPGEVARLAGTPPSAVRVSKALDDFARGSVRPLWRPILPEHFAPPAASTASGVTPTRAPVQARANRFAGKCALCGGFVEAEAGVLLGGKAEGGFRVQHGAAADACPASLPAEADAPDHLARGAIHVLPEGFHRVSYGQTSGRPYATAWTPDGGHRLVTDGQGGRRPVPTGSWEQAPGAVTRLTPETLATPDQVSEYGHAFAKCVFCSRDLDLGPSITAGYGQVCAGKRGLPWG